jgi:L-fuconolactonase
MRVDAHQHFWRYQPEKHNWITDDMSGLKRDFLPQDLAPHLASNALDGSVAVQAEQSEEETFFLLDLAEHCPEVLGVVGWVDLRADTLPERLACFSQFQKLAGFRHVVQSEPNDRFLLDLRFLTGIARLQEFGFTYDVLIFPRQLPAAIEFTEKFPAQKFVVDHIAKPNIRRSEIDPWSIQMRRLASNPNVLCKVSGMVTEADWSAWRPADLKPYLDVAFDAFGPDRLMFGSDWPVCLLAGSYDQAYELVASYARAFPESDQSKIFGDNAAKFYGLEQPR